MKLIIDKYILELGILDCYGYNVPYDFELKAFWYYRDYKFKRKCRKQI